jgi:hypothetical protein
MQVKDPDLTEKDGDLCGFGGTPGDAASRGVVLFEPRVTDVQDA